MKTLEFLKSEWVFKALDTQITVRWDYKGKTKVGWQNCKSYLVSCIIYNDGSGILNKVCGTKYTTTLQPNFGNSLNYLNKILKNI